VGGEAKTDEAKAEETETEKAPTWNKETCEEKVCKDKTKKDNLCDVAEDKEDPCYEHCCGDLSCFPGESVVLIEGSGSVPLAKVRIGDRVLVENAGRLVYEPVLTFLHAFRTGPGVDMEYLTITHSLGEFRASSTHLVFVQPHRRDASDHAFVQPHRRDASGLASKIVGNLEVGDRLLVAVGTSEHHLVESRVVSIRSSSGDSGMFAPLTDSGTIVVDQVVASNYASTSSGNNLTHRLAHAFLFPVRAYHHLGFSLWLKPFWAWLCPAELRQEAPHWFCQGRGLEQFPLAFLEKREDLHPFLAVAYRGMRVDRLFSFL
jgi:hypothetical protein